MLVAQYRMLYSRFAEKVMIHVGKCQYFLYKIKQKGTKIQPLSVFCLNDKYTKVMG